MELAEQPIHYHLPDQSLSCFHGQFMLHLQTGKVIRSAIQVKLSPFSPSGPENPMCLEFQTQLPSPHSNAFRIPVQEPHHPPRSSKILSAVCYGYLVGRCFPWAPAE